MRSSLLLSCLGGLGGEGGAGFAELDTDPLVGCTSLHLPGVLGTLPVLGQSLVQKRLPGYPPTVSLIFDPRSQRAVG